MVRTYLGTGEQAALAAAVGALLRQHRMEERAARRAMLVLAAPPAWLRFDRLVTDLVRASLLVAGYHQHARGASLGGAAAGAGAGRAVDAGQGSSAAAAGAGGGAADGCLWSGGLGWLVLTVVERSYHQRLEQGLSAEVDACDQRRLTAAQGRYLAPAVQGNVTQQQGVVQAARGDGAPRNALLGGRCRHREGAHRPFTAYVAWAPETQLDVGTVPGLPGAHTPAASLDELRANLQEVLARCREESGGAGGPAALGGAAAGRGAGVSRLPLVSYRTLEAGLPLGFRPVWFHHPDGRTTMVPNPLGRDLVRPLLREILRDIERRSEAFRRALERGAAGRVLQ